ncbi:diguanylate cyclase/phosphodiesterase (GGDEF & EAL domains) with PAS/PAC sensor(s) [Olavius algarvensis Delta 1 endosymbiont]|nr:diguanylate cyclase/phosphodiesterase (GGDEF & EAL domains) with PAS/PAC sensor(s) [Olavius algarvensis Delta 1 endosymbiont]
MSVLGILTCEILELEFAYLLNSDQDIAGITVLENSRSARLLEALACAKTPNLNRVTDLSSFAPAMENGLEVLVQVLELGLHNRKKLLQQGLIDAACAMGTRVDAILLGYGLCGNALENPQALLADAGVPIFIPMDEDHPVDDCVGLVIGGRQAYYEEQCKVAGTFFMIPGWTCHWRRMFERNFGNLSIDMARRLFENYERSLLIPSPVMAEDSLSQNAKEFNKRFGLREEIRPGTLDILNESWNSAKTFLQDGDE